MGMSLSRSHIPLFLLLFLALATPASIYGAEGDENANADPAALLGNYLPATEKERSQIIDQLARGGDEAAKAINAFYYSEKLSDKDAIPLIAVLGRIDTPAALRTLRAIMAHSYLAFDEITDYRALFKRIYVSPEMEDAPTPRARLWKSLPINIREMVRRVNENTDEEINNDQKYTLLGALNEVLDDRQFYRPEIMSGLDLPADARKMLPRHKPDETRFGHGLSPIEITRLNRAALEAIFPEVIKPAPQMEIYYRFSDWQVKAAMEALVNMDTPGARELLFSYRTIGARNPLWHIAALRKMEGEDRLYILGQYLLNRFDDTSARARDALMQEGLLESSTGARMLSDLLDRVEDGEEGEYRTHVAKNILRAATALDERKATDLIGDALESRNEVIQHEAVGVVQMRPNMGADRNVIDALIEIFPNRQVVIDKKDRKKERGRRRKQDEWIPSREIINLLKGFRKRRIEAAIPFAIHVLDNPVYDVRLEACDTLDAIAEPNFGRNGVKWQKWYEEG